MTAPAFGDPRLPARFWAKVEVGPEPDYRPELGPCWLWKLRTDYNQGYAQFWLNGGPVGAHRLAYLTLVGPTPLTIDHLCRVRHCVNPAHHEPVTAVENNRRKLPKTHCPHGHAYTEQNSWHDSKGRRRCRQCKRKYARETYAAGRTLAGAA